MNSTTPRQDAKNEPSRMDAVDPRDIPHNQDFQEPSYPEDERAIYGVPGRLGAKAWFPDQSVDGYITGQTDQLCIIADKDGLQHAERWGVVLLRASGPGGPTLAAPTAAHHTDATLLKDADAIRDLPYLAFTPEQVERLRHDPWREVELRIKDVQALTAKLQDETDRYSADHFKAIDLLRDAAMQIGEIADNRLEDMANDILTKPIEEAQPTGDGGGAA